MQPVDIETVKNHYNKEIENNKEFGIVTLRTVVKASESTIEHFKDKRDTK